MNLFNLFAKITLDTSQYDKGLKEASKGASSFSSNIGNAFKSGVKVVTGFITTITAATTAVTALIAASVSYGDTIDKESQKLSMSTDEYQKWSYILQLCGSDVSSLTSMVRYLTNFTEELTEGDADSLLALQKLGIGYEDFLNMSYDEKLTAIITALQGMEDETERNSLAQDIFGRSYQELLPLLNQSSTFIDEVTASMEELGLIISEEVTTQAAELSDQFTTLKTAAKAWGYSLLSDLYPYISLLINGLQGLMTGASGAMDALTEGLVGLIDSVAAALPSILDTAADLLLNILNGLITILPDIIPTLTDVIENILFTCVEILPTMIDSLSSLAVALFDGLFQIDWGALIIQLLEVLFELVASDIPNLVLDLCQSLIDLVMSFFSLEGLAYFGKLGIMLAQAIVNGLIASLESGVNGIISVINAILDGISALWTWAGLDGIPHIPEVSIPRVDWYEQGGLFGDAQRGTLYGAGENGAEIVAQGRRGTGVLNVEQFSEAMVDALSSYGMAEIIGNAATAVVNGVVAGIRQSAGNSSNGSEMTVRIGDRPFKAYVMQIVNETLNARGRKTLNTITAY